MQNLYHKFNNDDRYQLECIHYDWFGLDGSESKYLVYEIFPNAPVGKPKQKLYRKLSVKHSKRDDGEVTKSKFYYDYDY